jgi:hypothetical protein
MSRKYGTETCLSQDLDVIGSLAHALLAAIQPDGGPQDFCPCIDLDDCSEYGFDHVPACAPQ